MRYWVHAVGEKGAVRLARMVESRTIFVQPNLFNPQVPIPDAPMVRRVAHFQSSRNFSVVLPHNIH